MNFITRSFIFTLVILNSMTSAFSQDRRPSFPFVTGDGFRYLSTHIYDETTRDLSGANVLEYDVIFLKSELVNEFYVNIHPKIRHRYILISHNSDASAPSLCPELLDDNKLIAWLAQNAHEVSHPKLIPIPIGLENRYNRNGNPVIVSNGIKLIRKRSRDIPLYMNFSIATSPKERSEVFHLLKNKSYCVTQSKKYADYLNDLSRSVFVLSPRGNGYDCHRTWETLYMGAFPIVKSSSMDPLFKDLPVVIINNWNEVTEEFLQKKHKEFSAKEFNLDKIYIDYWSNLIRDLKRTN